MIINKTLHRNRHELFNPDFEPDTRILASQHVRINQGRVYRETPLLILTALLSLIFLSKDIRWHFKVKM